MEDKNPIQVSERLFFALEYLAEHGETGLLELSNALSLNKSTMHRVLNSLICLGYVSQDLETSKYSATYKLCKLSSQILAGNDIINIARPFIKQLAHKSGETVHLVQIESINAIYIDKVESSANSVRLVSKVGKTIPLYCSGVGKALLAKMDDEKIRSIWDKSEIVSYTDYTVRTFEELMKQINHIRKTGYATDDEEMELGVKCVAIALPDIQGKPVNAISISAPKDRMTDENVSLLKDLLFEAKESLSKVMG